MAQPANYPYRGISERAYLSEIAIEMSTQMACLIDMDTSNLTNLRTKVRFVAERILAIPKFASQKVLVDRVLEKTESYWKNLKFPDQKPLTEIAKHIGTNLLTLCGFEVVPLQIPPFIQLDPPFEEMTCFEFALARAGVEEAFPFSQSNWSIENLLQRLSEWGFRTILEKSKPGDLVVFLKDGIPQHMGIRYKDGILSKPGNAQEYAYVHTLEEAFEDYGNQVLFFRRN